MKCIYQSPTACQIYLYKNYTIKASKSNTSVDKYMLETLEEKDVLMSIVHLLHPCVSTKHLTAFPSCSQTRVLDTPMLHRTCWARKDSLASNKTSLNHCLVLKMMEETRWVTSCYLLPRLSSTLVAYPVLILYLEIEWDRAHVPPISMFQLQKHKILIQLQ